MMLGAHHDLALSTRYPVPDRWAKREEDAAIETRGLARLPRCSYRALEIGAWHRSSTQGPRNTLQYLK